MVLELTQYHRGQGARKLHLLYHPTLPQGVSEVGTLHLPISLQSVLWAQVCYCTASFSALGPCQQQVLHARTMRAIFSEGGKGGDKGHGRGK